MDIDLSTSDIIWLKEKTWPLWFVNQGGFE